MIAMTSETKRIPLHNTRVSCGKYDWF